MITAQKRYPGMLCWVSERSACVYEISVARNERLVFRGIATQGGVDDLAGDAVDALAWHDRHPEKFPPLSGFFPPLGGGGLLLLCSAAETEALLRVSEAGMRYASSNQVAEQVLHGGSVRMYFSEWRSRLLQSLQRKIRKGNCPSPMWYVKGEWTARPERRSSRRHVFLADSAMRTIFQWMIEQMCASSQHEDIDVLRRIGKELDTLSAKKREQVRIPSPDSATCPCSYGGKHSDSCSSMRICPSPASNWECVFFFHSLDACNMGILQGGEEIFSKEGTDPDELAQAAVLALDFTSAESATDEQKTTQAESWIFVLQQTEASHFHKLAGIAAGDVVLKDWECTLNAHDYTMAFFRQWENRIRRRMQKPMQNGMLAFCLLKEDVEAFRLLLFKIQELKIGQKDQVEFSDFLLSFWNILAGVSTR